MTYERLQGEIDFQAPRDPETGAVIPEKVFYLWDHDVSRLVRETYGKPFNMLSIILDDHNRCGQDTCVLYTIPDIETGEWDGQTFPSFEQWRDTPLDDMPEKRVDAYRWEKRWEQWHPFEQTIFNDLHERGLMPAGNYIVHAWW